jgi:hypothetical protein
MRSAAQAITTALILTTLAVRLHRNAIVRARADGYLTALHDVQRGILTPPPKRER